MGGAPAADLVGLTHCRVSAPVRYIDAVTVVQTLLVFVGIPAAIILFLFLAVYGKSLARQPNRYRPGKAWDYEPAWYVPHPDVPSGSAPVTSTTATGGASGEW